MTAAGRRLTAGLMVCIWGLGSAFAQGVPADESWASAWPDSAQVQQVLDELAVSGAPLSAAERQVLLGGRAEPASPAADPSRRRPMRVLSWRGQWLRTDPATGIGRLDFQEGPIGTLVRRIGPRSAGGPASWAAWLQGDSWEFSAGGMAMSHGFGLMCAPAGRGSSLAAGSSLAPPRAGLRRWPYPADGAGFQGVGAALGSSGCKLEGAVGRAEGQDEDPAAVALARIECGRGSGRDRFSILVAKAGQEQGVSLATSCQGDQVHWNFESMVWQPGRGAEKAVGAAADVGARLGDMITVEGAVACNRTDPGPALGVKPPVLTGWRGHGWALRGVLRPQARAALKVLAAGSLSRPSPPSREKEDREILEVECDWPLPAPWALSGRWRRQATRTWEWTERFPWQPARLQPTRETTLLSLTVVWTASQAAANCGLRSLRSLKDAEILARHLITIGGKRSLGRSWVMRGSWAGAWGDDLDLVSACVPFSGLVLPRHWGRWSSESLLGIECLRQAWTGKFAVSRRQPSPPQSQPADLQVWIEAAWHW